MHKAKMQEVFQYTLEGVVQLFIIDQEIKPLYELKLSTVVKNIDNRANNICRIAIILEQ